jgi:hypothetical protein
MVQAFSNAAGGCMGGVAAVEGLHLDTSGGRSVVGGTLAESRIVVTVGDTILDASSGQATTVPIGQDLMVTVDSGDIGYLGVLVRLSAPAGIDTTGALVPGTNTQVAAVCAAPVVGITHTNANEKMLSTGMVRFDEAVDGVVLDVTVVFINGASGSVYGYTGFPLNFRAAATPTNAPIVGGGGAPTAPAATTPTGSPVAAAAPTAGGGGGGTAAPMGGGGSGTEAPTGIGASTEAPTVSGGTGTTDTPTVGGGGTTNGPTATGTSSGPPIPVAPPVPSPIEPETIIPSIPANTLEPSAAIVSPVPTPLDPGQETLHPTKHEGKGNMIGGKGGGKGRGMGKGGRSMGKGGKGGMRMGHHMKGKGLLNMYFLGRMMAKGPKRLIAPPGDEEDDDEPAAWVDDDDETVEIGKGVGYYGKGSNSVPTAAGKGKTRSEQLMIRYIGTHNYNGLTLVGAPKKIPPMHDD